MMTGNKYQAAVPQVNRRIRYEKRPSRYEQRHEDSTKRLQFAFLIALSITAGTLLAFLF